jgi:hypothetical protein
MTDNAARAHQQRMLLAALAADEAEDARLYARRMRRRADLARLWPDTPQGPEEFGVIELAGTARIGQARASSQLVDAVRLVETFPRALALLKAGLMFRETAVLLLQLTTACTEAVQAAVEARVLDRIARANTADVRRVVQEAIVEVEAELDPALTLERLAAARRGRRVWTRRGADGMGQVGAELDLVVLKRWALDLTELVRAQKVADKRAGVVRSQSQREADLFAELPGRHLALLRAVQQGRVAELLAAAGRHDASSRASGDPGASTVPDCAPDDDLAVQLLGVPVRNPMVLNIHIPMTTLLDRNQRAGQVEGLGPITAEHARLLVPYAGLRRVFVEPDSGTPFGLDPDHDRHRAAGPPSPALDAQSDHDRRRSRNRPRPQRRSPAVPAAAGPALRGHRLLRALGSRPSRPRGALPGGADERLEPGAQERPLSPRQAPRLGRQPRRTHGPDLVDQPAGPHLLAPWRLAGASPDPSRLPAHAAPTTGAGRR